MGSGDPSGLQNRRELALLALVSSTLTRFRQDLRVPSTTRGRFAQDFAGGLRCPQAGSTSKPARVSFAGSGEFDSHTLPPAFNHLGARLCRAFGALQSLTG
jgi:hypothetical protein